MRYEWSRPLKISNVKLDEFDVEEALRKLKGLARKDEYKDGYHLGLRGDIFREHWLAIELEFGEFIYDLVLKKKPSMILELGTANGYSTCWFLLGIIKNNKGRLMTVDRENRQPKVWDLLTIPTGRLFEVRATSGEFLEEFNRKLDLVFLDTEHRIELLIKDIEVLVDHLKKDAQLLIHDTFGDPELGKQLKEYFKKWKNFTVESIDKSCGLMIATYKGDSK